MIKNDIVRGFVAVMTTVCCAAAYGHSMYKAHPFGEVDADNDGKISAAEYDAHSAKHAEAKPNTAAVAASHPFSEIDTDKDGSITKAEYSAHSAKHGSEVSHAK